ncbi:MAG: energy-coupling factor transporter transmembrane component T family protein, partial [Rhodoferax sp.]
MAESPGTGATALRRRRDFLERGALRLAQQLEHALEAESSSAQAGMLQGLDPRVKLVGLLALVGSTLLARSLTLLVALLVLAVVLAAGSGISAARLGRQVWAGVLLFTGAMALPALFLVPGPSLWQLPLLHWTLTLTGLRSAALLLMRAESAATFAALLVLSTPWPHLLKALRTLGVPLV